MKCSHCGTELPLTALFCGECGRSLMVSAPVEIVVAPAPVEPLAAEPFTDVPITAEPIAAEPIAAAPIAAPPLAAPVAAPAAAEEDFEATRIVGRASSSPRFVLQFSTGESVTVSGTGLIGRNPMAEPGEYFDYLIPLFDPGKSVSKTHLEFGHDAEEFWVTDRFSGNGTAVRQPEQDPKRCEPGKRYRVARGTRIAIGEQFFVVS